MPWPVARARYLTVRNFSSNWHPQAASLSSEATDLLNNVRSLSTRGRLKEACNLCYSAPPQHCSYQIYSTLFHACARHGCLQEGVYLHHHMLSHDSSNPPELFVSNHLVNMYAKCGHLEVARRLFDEMPQRNIVSWVALISGYAQYGDAFECFLVFSDMLGTFRPNEFAFASVLTSCDYKQGKSVHALALKMAWDASVYVGNALITMYNKAVTGGGCVDDASTIFETMEFHTTVSWNSMITGFQLQRQGARAIKLFICMLGEGVSFDRVTLLSVFSSLSESEDDASDVGLRCCSQLHCLSIKSGFVTTIAVATALVKSYSDLGGEAAHCYKLFLDTSCRDTVSWTGIITVYAEREPEEALCLYRQMRREDISPDLFTFSIVLKACAGLVTERPALAVHSHIIKVGLLDDIVLANALIHAYARCGSISFSEKVFDNMRFRDLVSWNTVLKAYALHGQAMQALQLFGKMNIQPDSATMVALLTACSHAGLVEEGLELFHSMFAKYGISPQLDHYACVVDVLGRAGRVSEAEKLINRMPMEPDYVVWSALLCSCRKHGETQLAKLAAEKMRELDPGNSLGYVQMSNIYCSGGSYSQAVLIRKEMRGSRVRKDPGLSWIEIGSRIHEFASGGRRHPQREIIYTKLDVLIGQLKEIGYVPETGLALHDVEEEHKEEEIYHHSEKLALVFAVMNEGSLPLGGTLVRIMKNIRICVDCHNFMKLASDLLQKEIVVRDSNRFHHFKEGICSCNDYW